MNIPLKVALAEKGCPAYISAKAADVNPNKLSRVIMEIAEFTNEEKRRMSGVLEKPVAELFPDKDIVNA